MATAKVGGSAIRPQCNLIVMTDRRETNYGCPVPLNLINRRYNPREPILLNVTQEKVDDMTRIKGHEFATDPYGSDFVVKRNMEIPFSFDASLELLALLMSSAMGHDGTVDSGVPVYAAFAPAVPDGTLDAAATARDADGRSTLDLGADLPASVVVGDGITFAGITYPIATIAVGNRDSITITVPVGFVAADNAAYSVVKRVSYRHDLRAGDICTHDQFPSTTWITGHSPYSGLNAHPESFILCEGVIVNDLTVGVSSKSWLDLTGTAYSNGRIDSLSDLFYTAPAANPTAAETAREAAATATRAARQITGVFAAPGRTEAAKNYLIGPNIEIGMWAHGANALDPAVLAADFVKNDEMTRLFRGFEFSIGNNLDMEDAHSNIAAAGVYLDSLRVGDRTYNLSLTVEGNQGDSRWDAYREDTVHRIDIRMPFGNPVLSSLTAGKNPRRYCTFSFPVVTIDNIATGFDGIRSTLELTVKPFAHDVAGGAPSPIFVTIENDEENYNIAA